MTLTEKILQHLESMPESARVKVLQFVQYLESKIGKSETEDEADWFTLSLSQAMQGMEQEPTLYSLDDIKDSFS